MSLVKVGDVVIGSVRQVPAVTKDGIAWQARRVSKDEGMVLVGQADTKEAALTLIGQSLVHRVMDDRIPPDKRARLAEALNMLEGVGLGDIASFIQKAVG